MIQAPTNRRLLEGLVRWSYLGESREPTYPTKEQVEYRFDTFLQMFESKDMNGNSAFERIGKVYYLPQLSLAGGIRNKLEVYTPISSGVYPAPVRPNPLPSVSRLKNAV
jgi:hypothetical protein